MIATTDKEKIQALRNEGFTHAIDATNDNKLRDWLEAKEEVKHHREFHFLKTNFATLCRLKFGKVILQEVNDDFIKSQALQPYHYHGQIYEASSDFMSLNIYINGKLTYKYSWIEECIVLSGYETDVVGYLILDHEGDTVLKTFSAPYEYPYSVMRQLINNAYLRPSHMPKAIDRIYGDQICSFRYDEEKLEILSVGTGEFYETWNFGRVIQSVSFNSPLIQGDFQLYGKSVNNLIDYLVHSKTFNPIASLPPKDLFPNFEECLNLQ